MIQFAYIDPGIGGIVLQLALASMVGVIYRFRKAVYRLYHRIVRRGGDKPDAE